MNKANNYLEKLERAVNSGNPLKIAIISYHAFRDSPQAIELKELTKEGYDECALSSIIAMSKILTKAKWEQDKVEEYLLKAKQLAGLT